MTSLFAPQLLTIGAFFSAYTGSDLFGKLIFIGLIALSLVSWVVLVHQIWICLLLQKLSAKYVKLFQAGDEQILNRPVDSLPALPVKELANPFAEIFIALKNKTAQILDKNLYFSKQQGEKNPRAYLSEKDIDLVESQALIAVSMQVKQLEKHLFILSTVVTLAPFLGLLGTVWGILQTFSGMQAGLSTTSNNAVLAGLATALTTTVLGLLVAIPALVALNYLKSRFRGLAADMENFLYLLLSTVELQYRKVDMPT